MMAEEAVEHLCHSPLEYLRYIYSIGEDGNPKKAEVLLSLDRLPEFCARQLEETARDGRSLVDVGCGAVMHNAFTLSRYFSQLTLADKNPAALDLLNKWLDGRDIGFDWLPYLRLVADAEGKEVSAIEQRVRQSIKSVVACDVHDESAGITAESRFDAVASFGAIAANSTGEQQLKKALSNVLSLLKLGGKFIYLDGFVPRNGDCESYKQQVFPSAETAKTVVSEMGVDVDEWYAMEHDECFGEFLMFGTKRNGK